MNARLCPRNGSPGGDGILCKSYFHLHQTVLTDSKVKIAINTSRTELDGCQLPTSIALMVNTPKSIAAKSAAVEAVCKDK